MLGLDGHFSVYNRGGRMEGLKLGRWSWNAWSPAPQDPWDGQRDTTGREWPCPGDWLLSSWAGHPSLPAEGTPCAALGDSSICHRCAVFGPHTHGHSFNTYSSVTRCRQSARHRMYRSKPGNSVPASHAGSESCFSNGSLGSDQAKG